MVIIWKFSLSQYKTKYNKNFIIQVRRCKSTLITDLAKWTIRNLEFQKHFLLSKLQQGWGTTVLSSVLYCVGPALIIFVYHKTREEAGTVYQTNEDGSKFHFICSQTMKNIPMILFIAGGGDQNNKE